MAAVAPSEALHRPFFFVTAPLIGAVGIGVGLSLQGLALRSWCVGGRTTACAPLPPSTPVPTPTPLPTTPTRAELFSDGWTSGVENWIQPIGVVLAGVLLIVVVVLITARILVFLPGLPWTRISSRTRRGYAVFGTVATAAGSLLLAWVITVLGEHGSDMSLAPVIRSRGLQVVPELWLAAVPILVCFSGAFALTIAIASQTKISIVIVEPATGGASSPPVAGTAPAESEAARAVFAGALTQLARARRGIEIPAPGSDVADLLSAVIVSPERAWSPGATRFWAEVLAILRTTPWAAHLDLRDADYPVLTVRRNGHRLRTEEIRLEQWGLPSGTDLQRVRIRTAAAFVVAEMAAAHSDFDSLGHEPVPLSLAKHFIAVHDFRQNPDVAVTLLSSAVALAPGNLPAAVALQNIRYRRCSTTEDMAVYSDWLDVTIDRLAGRAQVEGDVLLLRLRLSRNAMFRNSGATDFSESLAFARNALKLVEALAREAADDEFASRLRPAAAVDLEIALALLETARARFPSTTALSLEDRSVALRVQLVQLRAALAAFEADEEPSHNPEWRDLWTKRFTHFFREGFEVALASQGRAAESLRTDAEGRLGDAALLIQRVKATPIWTALEDGLRLAGVAVDAQTSYSWACRTLRLSSESERPATLVELRPWFALALSQPGIAQFVSLDPELRAVLTADELVGLGERFSADPVGWPAVVEATGIPGLDSNRPWMVIPSTTEETPLTSFAAFALACETATEPAGAYRFRRTILLALVVDGIASLSDLLRLESTLEARADAISAALIADPTVGNTPDAATIRSWTAAVLARDTPVPTSTPA